jgi:hypothetical protein
LEENTDEHHKADRSMWVSPHSTIARKLQSHPDAKASGCDVPVT